jgi:hypothetical protein
MMGCLFENDLLFITFFGMAFLFSARGRQKMQGGHVTPTGGINFQKSVVLFLRIFCGSISKILGLFSIITAFFFFLIGLGFGVG